MMVMAMMQWTREDPQTLFPELCRRPADLDPDDKERGDRRPRWQHLGHQRRLQRESLPGGAASSPRPWHCQALPGIARAWQTIQPAEHFTNVTRLLGLRLLQLFQ